MRVRQVPPPLRAWKDPVFLRYLAANLLLRSSIRLFKLGVLPRGALAVAYQASCKLRREASRHRRRLRDLRYVTGPWARG
jgi:hypothetical protein